MRAASECLKGTLSPHSAQAQYGVDRHCLRYYRKQLMESGFAAAVEAASTPALAAVDDAPSTREESSTGKSKTAFWDEYSQAYIFAGELINKQGIGRHAAAAQASKKFGVSISASTALRASMRASQPPSKPGRQLIMGEVIENRLEMLCLVMREMRVPIFQSMILNYANALVRGTEMAELFKHHEVRRHWYYHWLGRCKRLKTGNIRPLEVTRAKWATPENALQHYEMLADLMVELGLAVRNENFKEDEENSEPVKIIKPGRIFSMDETRLTNDATVCSKAKSSRTLLAKDGDCGETIVNKGGGDGTGIGGSSADGMDTPGFFIFANNIIHAGADDTDVAASNRPVCRRADPTDPSKPLPCRFWCNEKGGVTGDLGIRYIRGCID